MIRRQATPALTAFAALAVACLSRPLLGDRVEALLAAAGLAAAFASVLLNVGGLAMKRAGFLTLGACLGFFLGFIGVERMRQASDPGRVPLPLSEVSSFTGTLIQDSSLSRDSRTVLRVRLDGVRSAGRGISVNAAGRALVFVSGDYRFALGQRLFFHAGLGAPSRAGGVEQFVSFCARDGIRSLGFSRPIWELRARARQSIHRRIASVGFPASALLEALLVGGREDVPAELAERFRKAGSSHVLALSGLHAAIVFGFVSLILRFTSRRGVKFFLGVAALFFYQFIAGPLPSLLRATLMLVLGGAALLLDRDVEPMNILALSGLAVLAADPFQVQNLSFQLSYLALFGLISVAPLLTRAAAGLVPKGLLASLCVSAAAQLATFPVVMAAFGDYRPSGLAAGLVLVPLTTAFLWLGLFWLLLSPLLGPFALHAVAPAFGGLYSAISGSAGVFSRLPGLHIEAGAAVWAATAGFVAFIVLCLLPFGPSAGPALGARRAGEPGGA